MEKTLNTSDIVVICSSHTNSNIFNKTEGKQNYGYKYFFKSEKNIQILSFKTA